MAIRGENVANRPIFLCDRTNPYYKEQNVCFEFFNGFSPQQKQKSILSLHSSAMAQNPHIVPLEVSRASQLNLGKRLSAFNLIYRHTNGEVYAVESIFQSSKVFEKGGPYTDLLRAPSLVAKKDDRIKESGRIIGFSFLGNEYSSEPKTAFYDWVYINALNQHEELHEELLCFNAFTDIEFNPKKSINCQARAVAIFASLKTLGLLEDVLKDFSTFINSIYKTEEKSFVDSQLSWFD